MRKLLLLLFALCSLYTQAQSIISDEKDSRGNRTIVCSDELVTTGATKLYVSLSYSKNKNFDMYIIGLKIESSYPTTIKENARFRFLQNDGTKISLVNAFDSESYKLGDVYSNSINGEITATQLSVLLIGVESIQIEARQKMISEKVNSERFAKVLLLQYDLIQNRL